MIGGGTLVASCVALYIAVRIRSHAQNHITLGGSHSSIHSFSVISTARGELLLTYILIMYQVFKYIRVHLNQIRVL